MTQIDNLTTACNELQSAVTLGVDKINELQQELAATKAQAIDDHVIEQLTSELRVAAERLRTALAPSPT